MIPQETIEQIRQTTDIVALIGEYLRLKKRGRNHLAICPFHTEKTPSFSVSEDKQIYHCFGCGKGGNAFTFLMEHERMSFVEAVRHLARKAGITIREEAGSDQRRESLERIAFANHLAVDYFHDLLFQAKYKSVLQDYLIKRRKMTDESIKCFKLGLAGQSWDGYLSLANSKGLNPDDLVTAGLVLKSESKGNYFDRFRERLMIPIFSLSQKPIAFGGRTLKKGEPAKYINSPETPLYTKSMVLYGLNVARDWIRRENEVYVVEGYFDVISLWQAGIRNVVASSGTAFTSHQARLLARFAEKAYLFFDADSAGRNAAIKSVDHLYDAGLDVMVIDAPPGEDPDTVAQSKGKDGLLELREKALDFIEFRVKGIDTSAAGIIGKEKLIKEFSTVGNKIADPTRRSLFFERAEELLKVKTELFRMANPASGSPPVTSPGAARKYDPVEFGFLSLLLNGAGGIDRIFEKISPEDIDSKQLSRLYSAIITQYRDTGAIDVKRLIDSLTDTEFISLITEVASNEWEPESKDSELVLMASRLTEKKTRKIVARLKSEMYEAEKSGNDQRANEILDQIRSYKI
ncbi:MAG: DNA primase [bacterium]|nr:DNA primase [bacterium]